MTDEPFGRQPLPVTVTLSGEPIDVDFWLRHLIYYANCKGEDVQTVGADRFIIYPRAVND